jgi:MYXO-CTERM domain-containing protein
MAEEQNLTDLLGKAKSAVANAMAMCKGMDHHRHPRGAMHTGVGSTSQGVDGGEVAGGLGILGAAGAGALVLRRRRAGSES